MNVIEETKGRRVVIIGAGPAGLTAAYELCRAGVESVVVEKDSIVGGIARTVNYKGYLFDIGGHRFFTKVKSVEDLWHEVMGEDFLKRGRLSRIYYNKKFFYYPLRFSNALSGLGLWNSFLIVLSYLKSRIFPQSREDNLEQWVSNRFGKRLYETFFKTYTEKVWGIPCSEIRAEWAAQRIKGLSLSTALRNALLKQKGSGGEVIKTLIDSFYYPRLGPGMMWERIAEKVERSGSSVRMETEVEGIICAGGRVKYIEVKDGASREERIEGSDFISTMPIRELIEKLKPAAPQKVIEAARSLNYRDFLTVTLIIGKADLFPDNWIYIHDPDVKVGRIQNFKNWSPQMVPDSGKTCLGLEYFCFEGDGLWTMKDEELIELGKKELGISGLADPSDVEDGTVVRMPKAYPVYDSTYQEALGVIREFLSSIDNLQLTGRNGMHKYNNQDHSMLTAMLAVRNILGDRHDLWEVNADQEYHEEVREGEGEGERKKETGESAAALLSSTQPRVPLRSQLRSADRALIQSFGKMDKLALAAAIGTVLGLSVFIGTLWLMSREHHANFALLGQYFIGYTVTLEGAFIGMGYSFLWGFMFGWLFAYLRNLFIGYFIHKARKKAKHESLRNLLDYI